MWRGRGGQLGHLCWPPAITATATAATAARRCHRRRPLCSGGAAHGHNPMPAPPPPPPPLVADPSLIGRVRLEGTTPGGAAGGDGSAAVPLPPPPPLLVYPDAVSEAEEAALVAEADKWLRKRAYEGHHFDRVIAGYREVQTPLRKFSTRTRATLDRLIATAFPQEGPQGGGGEGGADGVAMAGQPEAAAAGGEGGGSSSSLRPSLLPVHVLDLESGGVISRHVDHTEYSGGSIVGLSLLTDAVMTLHHEPPETPPPGGGEGEEQQGAARGGATTTTTSEAAADRYGQVSDGRGAGGPLLPLRLPRRSLYILRGPARYEWAHALPLSFEWDDGTTLTRTGRRLALIFRDPPPG
jgi:hypothetical protein